MTTVFAESKTGATFMSEVEVDSFDGSLTVLSNYGHGYRSAHRAVAQSHFPGQTLWCVYRLTWINSSGVRVAMTTWNTQEHRSS